MTSYLSSLLCIVSQLSFCALAYLSVACNLFKMFITAGKKVNLNLIKRVTDEVTIKLVGYKIGKNRVTEINN